MTRRQKTIARDFPFVVKTPVPPGGLGERLNAMYSFHRDRGIQLAVLPHQHDARGNYLLWYFDSHGHRSLMTLLGVKRTYQTALKVRG